MKTANRIVMSVAGVLFLFAAVMKSYQLMTEPIISKGFWESWAFFVIQIPLELGLGIWLLCGLFRKAAWLIAAVSFGLFMTVTLHKGITGAESCGCFGTVQVNPWITLSTIDIPLFLGLLIFRPKGEKLLPPPWPSAKHFFGVAVPTFALLVTIVPVLIFNKPPDVGKDYIVVRHEEWTKPEQVQPKPRISKRAAEEKKPQEAVQQKVTVEEQPAEKAAVEEQTPEKALSEAQPSETVAAEEWPLLEYIDIADSLRPEISIVLLYHHDCPDCLEAIPAYEQMNLELAGNYDAIRVAFVEVPPFGPESEDPIPADTTCLKGKLDPSKKWYFVTPLVVVTVDGVVAKSWEVEVPGLEEILEAVYSGD